MGGCEVGEHGQPKSGRDRGGGRPGAAPPPLWCVNQKASRAGEVELEIHVIFMYTSRFSIVIRSNL